MSGAIMASAAGGLPLSITAPSVTASSASSPVTSNPTLITVTGGIPPYSYACALSNQSGPGTITVLSGTTATPSFRSGSLPASTTATCDAIYTVTDAASATANNSATPANISLTRT